MRNPSSIVKTLLVAALIGGAIAQEPSVRDDPAAASSAAAREQKPRIQIQDRREFIRELTRLGVGTSIGDRDTFKRLFAWIPEFKTVQHRLIAYLPLQAASESNLSSIYIDYAAGNRESEKGDVHVFLHSSRYCLRMDDLKAALDTPYEFFSEGLDEWGRFKKVTSIFGARFQTSPGTSVHFFFNYQECAQQIKVNRNIPEHSGIPRIQYSESTALLQKLRRLGSLLSIGDREVIRDLTGWYPSLQPNPGTGGLYARLDQNSPESEIGMLRLGFVPGVLESERGAFQLDLRPDRYCIRFEDTTSVLGKPARLYDPPLHWRSELPRSQPVYGAIFQTSGASLIHMIFEYQECASRVHVFKNLK